MEGKIKHLEMIQGIINRLSTNSFLLKGWSVILLSALFALAEGQSNEYYIFLACLPVLVFWGLDAYFLYLEKQYRDLYDKTRATDDGDITFSMDTRPFQTGFLGWFDKVFSKTLLPFHGVLLVAILVFIFLKLCNSQGG